MRLVWHAIGLLQLVRTCLWTCKMSDYSRLRPGPSVSSLSSINGVEQDFAFPGRVRKYHTPSSLTSKVACRKDAASK